MKLNISIILVLLIPITLKSQEKEYPYSLKPGESFVGSATVDSMFWVLKNSQYEKAIAKAIELQKADKLIELLETKSNRLGYIIALKDSTISDYRIGYDRYRIKWEGVHEQLEDSEVKVLKLKRWTLFSGVLGVGAGVLLGVLVF